jgi:hypothetical protein
MVTFSDSFVTFLVKEREKGSKLAGLMANAIAYECIYPIYKRVFTNEEINYITMRNDGLISFLPKGKEHKVNDQGFWQRENRQAGKPAKIIRRVLNPVLAAKFTNHEYEKFGNSYKATFNTKGLIFELNDSSHIEDVYNTKHAEGGSSLSTSCMRLKRGRFEIYENCNVVSVLSLKNEDGELVGRALVWKLDTKSHGKLTFMDRIYVCEDFRYENFIDYAADKGWWYKSSYTTFTEKDEWINPKTGLMEKVCASVNTNTECNKFPYIDTFTYGNDGVLYNYKKDGWQHEYSNVDGTRDNNGNSEGESEEEDHEGEMFDEFREEWISEDDAVCLSNHSSRGYRDQCAHIDDCHYAYVNHRNREYFHENDDKTIQINGTYYWTENEEIVYLHNGDYAMSEDTTFIESQNEYYLSDDDCVVCLANGEYEIKANASYVERNGEWYADDDDDLINVTTVDDGFIPEYLPDVSDEVTNVDGTWYYNTDKRVKNFKRRQKRAAKKQQLLTQ